MENIGIIGAGSIGAGYYKIFGEMFGYEKCHIYNRSPEKLKGLKGENKYQVDKLEDFLEKSDAIILAVKPQDFLELSEKMKAFEIEEKTIISAMAGIGIESLKKHLKSNKVIRTMPTTAIKEGEGVTGWIASNEITKEEKNAFKRIFSASGYLLELKTEKEIDAVITTSGSGVAYILYFAEQLVKQAINIGLKEGEANTAARKSLIGLGKLLEKDPEKSFAEIRNSITSKKGVTEAALNKMKELDLEKLVEQAVKSACKRSEQLNIN